MIISGEASVEYIEAADIKADSASVVILAWNAWEVTKACLDSIEATLRDGDEVIVVDNGSTDGTQTNLQAYPWVKVVRNDLNLGFAAGNNKGYMATTRPFVVFLNNDTIPTGRWLDYLLYPFSDEAVGATGPRSNYVTGPQMVDKVPYSAGDMLSMRHFAARWSAQHAREVEQVDMLIGFCMAVRRTAFEEVGGFDESFGVGGFEDNDLCVRLNKSGWKLCIAHGSFVHHEGHRTFDANGMDWYTEQQRNRGYFMSKHGASSVSFLVSGDGEMGNTEPEQRNSYYYYDRPEVVARIPIGARRVLELGCAAGRLGASLKNRQECYVIGIEKEPQPATEAASLLNEVIVADLSNVLSGIRGDFDAIVAADVLEHLEDPWSVVRQCVALLRPGGVIVVSIPNIANLAIIAGLAGGSFPYADAGILDRTHLRFFTRAGVKGMFIEAGLNVESLEAIRDPQFAHLEISPGGSTDISVVAIGNVVVRGVDTRRLDELAAVQFLVTARKRTRMSMPRRRPRVYDCIPFFNELDMLDARMEEMSPVVDVFAISESSLTYSGTDKPLIFPDQRERFTNYGREIRYLEAELPRDGGTWQREASQRDALAVALSDADPDDVVICCDLDEIVDAAKMDEIIEATSAGPVALAMPVYYYSLSWRSPQRWIHAKAFRARDMPSSFNWLRLSNIVGWGELPVVENAGWHLTYFGGIDRVHEKLSSFSHSEYNTPDIHLSMDERIRQGITVHGIQLEYVDDPFPDHLRKRFGENGRY